MINQHARMFIKILMLLCIFGWFGTTSRTASAQTSVVTIPQPDGTVFTVIANGTYPCQITTTGYSVVQDPNSGFWMYAIRNAAGNLVPSGVVVDESVQPPADITPEILPNEFSSPGRILLSGSDADGTIWYTTDLATWVNIPGSLTATLSGAFDSDTVSEIAGLASDGSIWYTSGQLPPMEMIADKQELASGGSTGYTNGPGWVNIPGRLQSLTVGINLFSDASGSDGLAGLASDGSIWYSKDVAEGTQPMLPWVNIPGSLTSITCADFNGDGCDGIAGLSADGSIWWMSDKDISDATWHNIPGSLSSLVTGDFSGDGKAGIAGFASDGSVWYTTDMSTWSSVPGNLASIAAGDFAGAGKDGLAGLASDGSIWYTPDLTNWTEVPGHLSTLVAGDLNGDGKCDLAGLDSVGRIWYTIDLQNWSIMPGRLANIYCSSELDLGAKTD